MRNELNNIEKIERYIRNEMSVDEKTAFEKDLSTNAKLQEELKLQQDLLKGLNNLSLKAKAKKAYRNYTIGKNGLKWGGILGGILIVFAASYFAYKTFSGGPATGAEITYELPELNESGDKLWADADKYLPYQKFTINAQQDTVIETQDGIVMAVPANCFLDENGNPVKGEIKLEVKEAIETNDIMRAGLNTRSGDQLLETGGMFYINARKDEKSLAIDPKKGIYTEVPTDEIKPGMQLYEGKRLADGTIDWIKPKPLEKFLIPVDIHSLNFYPPNYEDTLSSLKGEKDKRYKDSLYYSYARLFDVKTNTSKVDSCIIDGYSVNEGGDGYKMKTYNNRTEIDFLYLPYFAYDEMKRLINDGFIIKYSNADANNLPISGKTWVHAVKYHKNNIALNGESLFKTNCASCHHPNKLVVGPVLSGAKQRWKDAGVPNKIYDWVQNPKKLYDSGIPYIKSLVNNYSAKGVALMPGQKVTREDITAILDYVDSYNELDGINPSKIKAIWDDKFNNTILATIEFEERLQVIHTTCNSEILDLYVNNLDKKLCIIDSIASDYDPRFRSFALRGDGRIKEGQKHLEKLKKYYEEKTKAYTKAVVKTEKEFWNKHKEEKSNIVNLKSEFSKKDIQRLADNFDKELEMNCKSSFAQIGYPSIIPSRTGVVLSGQNLVQTYSTTVVTTGWCNIDRATQLATINRATLNFTDQNTGKTAIIKYEELTASVTEYKSYDRVFAYLIPDKLDSYMRMPHPEASGGDDFSEKLNELMSHQLVIIGYKGQQAYYNLVGDVKPGKYNDISLTAIDNNKLDNALNKLKGGKQKQKLVDELAFRFIENKEAARQKKVQSIVEFRERMQEVIFPCSSGATAMPRVPVADTTKIAD